MASRTALQQIAELLQAGNAQPNLHPERWAPSAFYDLHYRVTIVASAFEIHANSDNSPRRIRSALLKLLQFVAIRPWLLPEIRAWSAKRRSAQLSTFSSLRRGFLSDEMHDKIISFLVARGAFVPMGAHIAAGTHEELLIKLYAIPVELELFTTERQVLTELLNITITNDMLEGW